MQDGNINSGYGSSFGRSADHLAKLSNRNQGTDGVYMNVWVRVCVCNVNVSAFLAMDKEFILRQNNITTQMSPETKLQLWLQRTDEKLSGELKLLHVL